jgi:hypothetical protein
MSIFRASLSSSRTRLLLRLLVIVSLGLPAWSATAEADSSQAAPSEGSSSQAGSPESSSPQEGSSQGSSSPAGAPLPIFTAPDSSAPDRSAPDSTTPGEFASGRAESPTRVTLAQEFTYKVEEPYRVIKNRSSVRLEYAKYFLKNFFVQLDGKAIQFWSGDHRHDEEGHYGTLSEAYLQTSFGQTSIKAGIQTLPWGESILAPITDEVSPRDNSELFNFNLDELRLGQPMVVVDQFLQSGRWTAFYVPYPYFNEIPKPGSAYFFNPFPVRGQIEGDDGGEVGVSWRKSFASSDITFMAASLIDNDYALRMDTPGLLTRVKERFTLAGMVFNYSLKEDLIVRGEAALKSPKAFNDAAFQIVKKNELDTYLALDYAPSSTLTLSVAGVNQHIFDWDSQITSAPRDRYSLLLSATKLLMNDDLSINFMNFFSWPYSANLAILTTNYKWNDNVTLGSYVVVPYTKDEKSGLFPVRDQKQIGFKFQYQF